MPVPLYFPRPAEILPLVGCFRFVDFLMILVSLALLPSMVSQALFLVGVHFHPCDSESYDL